MYNLMFWSLIVCSGETIKSIHLFFEKVITKANVFDLIDKYHQEERENLVYTQEQELKKLEKLFGK